MKLAKRGVLYRVLQQIGAIAVIVAFSGSLSVQAGGLRGAALWAVLLTVGLIGIGGWQYLVWKKYSYDLNVERVNIVHGVIQKHERGIPMHRIQNVDITRNLAHRVLGIAQVNFETAGGQNTEASLKFVTYDQAKEIQRTVRRIKKDETADSSTVEQEQGDERKPVFALDHRELALLSLFSLNQVTVGILFGVFPFAFGLGSTVLNDIMRHSLLLLLPIGIIGLFVAWIASAAVTFSQYFDFKLWMHDEALEYERGLFNRKSGSIPFDKIQSVTVSENPLKRLFGYATIEVLTAGYAVQTQQQRGAEAAIPLAKRDHAIQFGQQLMPFDSLSVDGIPKRARRRYIGRYTLTVGLLTGIGFLVARYVTPVPYWTLLFLVPLVPVAAHYKWKHRGVGQDANHFVAQNGFWKRQTVVVPYYRMQTLLKTQTVLQKQWRLASLVFDTASTPLFAPGSRAIDIAPDTAERLRDDVLNRFKNRVL
jgi:putative membrane protein